MALRWMFSRDSCFCPLALIRCSTIKCVHGFPEGLLKPCSLKCRAIASSDWPSRSSSACQSIFVHEHEVIAQNILGCNYSFNFSILLSFIASQRKAKTFSLASTKSSSLTMLYQSLLLFSVSGMGTRFLLAALCASARGSSRAALRGSWPRGRKNREVTYRRGTSFFR
jgi:hypothetical protein